ncbi:hypothetical protein D3C75_465860 [compost metagenome]
MIQHPYRHVDGVTLQVVAEGELVALTDAEVFVLLRPAIEGSGVVKPAGLQHAGLLIQLLCGDLVLGQEVHQEGPGIALHALAGAQGIEGQGRLAGLGHHLTARDHRQQLGWRTHVHLGADGTFAAALRQGRNVEITVKGGGTQPGGHEEGATFEAALFILEATVGHLAILG